MITKLEETYPAFQSVKLWKLVRERAEAGGLGTDFLEAAGKVCIRGLDLSRDINRFFPTYTLHDETHIVNVCDWMVRLLERPESGARPLSETISARDAAMLIMAACCHDCGMSVSDQEKDTLRRVDGRHKMAWDAFFRTHPREEAEFRSTGKLSDETLRSFVRAAHHQRIEKQLKPEDWPAALTAAGLTRANLIALCKSHGEPLEKLTIPRGLRFDLPLCAVLLRLADILDFDASRAPESLFFHRGLNAPTNLEERISRTEWAKNRAGAFQWTEEGELSFTASFSDLQLEMEVRTYLEWVERELVASIDCLRQSGGACLKLPFRILADNVDRRNYRFGDFRLTMDQDKVRELLAGRNLYRDGGVFVRELLQNAVDAILTRRTRDRDFDAAHGGTIRIRTWRDAEGYDWFRIEDDGVGMREEDITNYFLKVGCSYYTSKQFEADQLRAKARGGFKPISRFGIGVLSCFLSDPEHNRLELSTRRLSPDPGKPNEGIRLSVTGLHGYYGLMGEADAGSPAPLPCPPGTEESSFREEPGTTLCVRASLYELGGYGSFRDILDRYVCFPDLRVEYRGPEGEKVYPTKNALMELAHRLNPAGPAAEPKTYRISLPEEAFKELQRRLPMLAWKRPPALSLRLLPLDWLSGSQAISGLAGRLEEDFDAAIRPVELEEGVCQGELHCEISCRPRQQTVALGIAVDYLPGFVTDDWKKRERIHGEGLRSGALFGERDPLYAVIYDNWGRIREDPGYAACLAREMGRSEAELREIIGKMAPLMARDLFDPFRHRIELPYKLLWNALPERKAGERALLSEIFGGGNPRRQEDESPCGAAFQGVCVDRSNLLGIGVNILGAALLLEGNRAPEVDLGREGIIGLPPELCVELLLLREKLGGSLYASRLGEIAAAARYDLLPARTLRAWMEAHPGWRAPLSCRPEDLAELRKRIGESGRAELPWADSDRLLCALQAAVWSAEFSLQSGCFEDSHGIGAVPKAAAIPEAFPAPLFAEGGDGAAFRIGRVYISSESDLQLYNVSHRLSQWLIRRQAQLEAKVPKLYKGLLRKLRDTGNDDELREAVNDSLRLLQSYPNNEFGIDDSLFLTEADFPRRS